MYSIVCYRNDKMDVLRGDYRGCHTDGVKTLTCVRVIDTVDLTEAVRVLDALRLARDSD